MNIKVSYRYTDNFDCTNDEELVISNRMGLPLEEILAAVDRVIDRSYFLPEPLGLPSISPITNPYMPLPEGISDHAHHENLELSETNDEVDGVLDVWELLVKVKRFDDVAEMELMRETRDYLYRCYKQIDQQITHIESLEEDLKKE